MLQSHGKTPAHIPERYECFDTIRAGEALGITFEKRDGTKRWAACSFLAVIDYDGATALTLHFTIGEIVITGKNLDPVWKNLSQSAVVSIRESSSAEPKGNEPWIGSICIQYEIGAL